VCVVNLSSPKAQGKHRAICSPSTRLTRVNCRWFEPVTCHSHHSETSDVIPASGGPVIIDVGRKNAAAKDADRVGDRSGDARSVRRTGGAVEGCTKAPPAARRANTTTFGEHHDASRSPDWRLPIRCFPCELRRERFSRERFGSAEAILITRCTLSKRDKVAQPRRSCGTRQRHSRRPHKSVASG